MNLTGGLMYVMAFVVAIAVLVVIHELGHYLVARAFNVKVLRFSFGFGRLVWSCRVGRDQTEWALCAIPLGGYVKMLDESEAEVPANERHRAFNTQSLWHRALIVVAGPLFNLLLAIVLYVLVFMSGVHEFRPVLGNPPAGTVAAEAGVVAGSTITALNGQFVTTWQDVRWIGLHELLDGDVLVIDAITPDGNHVQHRLQVPSGLGDQPEKDALRIIGLGLAQVKVEPVVGQVMESSPAAAAGLQTGDRLEAVDGVLVKDWSEFSARVRQSPGIPLLLDVARGDVLLQVKATPGTLWDEGKAVGRLGLAPKLPSIETDPRASLVRYGLIASCSKAVRMTLETSVLTLRMIGRMLTGRVSWRNVSGPVTVADYAGQSAQLGLTTYLRFLALISISLGVLNLLPIPILDGGHLLYYLAEAVAGKPLPEHVVSITQRFGMVLLGVLMLFAFYNDINRLVSG